MKVQGRKVLVCNCEETMDLDARRLAVGEDGTPTIHRHLCRTGMAAFESALAGDEPILVACTQEAPLFSEIAEDAGADERVSFFNIRERAGWTAKGQDPHAKIAALIEEAVLEPEPTGLKTIESSGLCLVYGAGQQALDAARMLNARLSVTLLLSDAADMVLPSVMDVAVYRGRIRSVSGSLGQFDVTVDSYAPILPSARTEPQFMMARDGAKSDCAVIVDISGGTPLVTGFEKRDGYFRADPKDPAAVARVLFEAGEMVGTFEKPLYVSYDASICAHSRSGRTGCTNCLDVCPAGAISDAGDTVFYDHGICAGCGSCAAACPTGAVSYAYPRRADLVGRLQTLIAAYARAGGKRPVLLLHDETYGDEMIATMARMGRGLPANVLPVGLHSVFHTGHEVMLAAILAGAQDVVWLANPQKSDELPPLESQIALAEALLSGLGHEAEGRFHVLEVADPDAVEDELYRLKAKPGRGEPRRIAAFGGKRDVARAVIGELRATGDAAADVIALPAGAPYGRISIDTDGCTLCLSCVAACPMGALSDNPERPQVRFTEAACVQCGLCADTCPEKVISLEPRYDLGAEAMSARILNEEKPATCISCGKPFGTQSTINRIAEKLSGNHWMYRSADQINLIRMCDDCRVSAQWAMPDSPMRMGERPRPRTTAEYLEADKAGLTIEDFLKRH
ncbi:4Fe-4S dicluster protein [Breoghania corrubedonensis]|uniref:4Fe-4S dicluster protein n=1 Tax=Breoghania corrubedonensis TaxID=665038 RepID=A0A2T5VAS8_9HYPH|nr:4Fe-4S binding protein [Breoghania corrubedonensis]PTW60856.1 4Fe-4S dicluster protein [Breoghania corrubedonensis]